MSDPWNHVCNLNEKIIFLKFTFLKNQHLLESHVFTSCSDRCGQSSCHFVHFDRLRLKSSMAFYLSQVQELAAQTQSVPKMFNLGSNYQLAFAKKKSFFFIPCRLTFPFRCFQMDFVDLSCLKIM